jgi:hypothetical protein
MLFSVSAPSPSDVWAVGQQQVTEDGPFSTLVEHWDGDTWSVVPAANPGSSGNSFYTVLAQGPGKVWAVGQQNGSTGRTSPAPHKHGTAEAARRVGSTGCTRCQSAHIVGGDVVPTHDDLVLATIGIYRVITISTPRTRSQNRSAAIRAA